MSEKKTELKNFNPRSLIEKYSIKNRKKNTNNYSSFWMGDSLDNHSSIFDNWEGEDVKPSVDIIALSSYRRAISNFVSILTGDSSIKVNYTTSGDSYTDGKTVTISSKMDDKFYDSTVGLALHEGSHIKLSDFDFLRNLENNIPVEYFNRGELKGYKRMEVLSHIKNLLNYVEDRRIDNFVFSTSPGYKGYYHSMYNKYFYAKIIDKALLTFEYTDENWDSYIFRILNITNKNTNLKALKGLRDIWNVLDLKTVNRLKSSEDAFKVSLEVYNIILNNVPDGNQKTDEDTGEVSYEKADGSDSSEENGEGGEGSGKEEPRKITDDEFDDLLNSIENNVMGSEGDSTEGGGESIEVDLPMSGGSSDGGTDVGKETKKVELSDSQKRTLENAIKKQNKFMEGDLPKKKVTKKVLGDLKTVEESGMSYADVGKDLKTDSDYYTNANPTKCVVVKNLTKSLIDSNTLSMLSTYKYSRYGYGSNENIEGFVEKGIRVGTMLGKKLQVRGESRDTKWTRQDKGRLDKRLIAELGFGNERVFSTNYVESYSDAILHISVDASGSMGGDKWDNTMTSVVAICKAVSMIQNVDVVVSIRSTHNSGGSYRSRKSSEHPVILIAYDSRVDKFSKVKNLFGFIRCSGTTPEGLCYEAIMNEIIPASNDRESYFLNFSDGMPMFSNDDVDYYHDTALNHTKKMVEEIKNRGIKVLSYFIGDDYGRDRNMEDFKRMYGKDSQFIDVTSVMAVSKTMNKKFLEK